MKQNMPQRAIPVESALVRKTAAAKWFVTDALAFRRMLNGQLTDVVYSQQIADIQFFQK